MAAKRKILIQGMHPIFDDAGRALIPSFVYDVKDTPLIQQYVSEGFATDVTAEEKTASTESTKPARTSKSQETDSTQTTGE